MSKGISNELPMEIGGLTLIGLEVKHLIENTQKRLNKNTGNYIDETAHQFKHEKSLTEKSSELPITQPLLVQTSFPHPPKPGSSRLPTTIENVGHLLRGYGITVGYNVIGKKLMIRVPGQKGAPDNVDNTAMAHILSLASLNDMSTGLVPEFVMAIADRNQINPVVHWIKQKSWDGQDRLPIFYETLHCAEDYPDALKQTLLYKWLLSAVAASLMPSGFHSRGVLVLQGAQSIGKTAWVNALVSDPLLREQAIKIDHHMDAGNKDSIITAVSHWIVEIGELDSSFKKDIARLKGFITSDRDKLRRPYGRSDSDYSRKTVFCASVNDAQFLIDNTGNTRFWTIPVVKVDYNHGVDMQQVFAQVAVDFEKGEQWWLTRTEEKCLEDFNKSHRVVNTIEERILAAIDPEKAKHEKLPTLTATELLQRLDIKQPTNRQCKEAVAALREHLGPSKRIRGQNKWCIPFKDQDSTGLRSDSPDLDDDDDY